MTIFREYAASLMRTWAGGSAPDHGYTGWRMSATLMLAIHPCRRQPRGLMSTAARLRVRAYGPPVVAAAQGP